MHHDVEQYNERTWEKLVKTVESWSRTEAMRDWEASVPNKVATNLSAAVVGVVEFCSHSFQAWSTALSESWERSAAIAVWKLSANCWRAFIVQPWQEITWCWERDCKFQKFRFQERYSGNFYKVARVRKKIVDGAFSKRKTFFCVHLTKQTREQWYVQNQNMLSHHCVW